MKMSFRPHQLLPRGLFWLFVMSLLMPHMAAARTTLQVGNGVELSFAAGDIDIKSGSGELFGVEIHEDGMVALTAAYLKIDADGTMGGPDWYIRTLLIKNALMPDDGLFINQIEAQDIFAGAFRGDTVPGDPATVTEQSFIKMTNLSVEAEKALVSVDEISSLPIRLAESSSGTPVVAKSGMAIKGMSVMPLEQSPGNDPLIDKLAERGINSVELDLIILSTIDVAETGMHVGYEVISDIRDLAAIEFSVRFVIDDDVYERLLPLLAAPEDNGMAMLGLSGAIAVESGRLVVDDTGLGDIAFAVAAAEEGVSEAEFRSMARMSAAAGVGATFPENVAWLLPPIEAMLQRGGRLTALASPDAPVPLSSVIGFAMFPDLAIDQLGIALNHQP